MEALSADGKAPLGGGSGALHSEEGAADRDWLRALMALRAWPGLGDRSIRRLVERFGSPEAALRAPPDQKGLPLSRGVPRRRDPDALLARADELLDACDRRGILVIGWGRPGYPASLAALHDPPMVLFLRGKRHLLGERMVAVVGARRATAYGRMSAEILGSRLARSGLCVVSGLALGIDGAAHRGALAAGGKTVAVLGAGIDTPHPRSHAGLFERIAEVGLLVSEFLPGEPPLPHHFPRRNRVIAALAEAVVVVEAAVRSGALITVDHALDLGREVFAVPGPVDSPQSVGTHALIRDGARILADLSAVPAEMGWEPIAPVRCGDPSSEAPPGVGSDARVLWHMLRAEARFVDDLVEASALEAGRALAALSELEIGGFAVRGASGLVRLREGTS